MSPQQVTKEGFSLSQAMGASGQDKKHAACLLHAPAIPYRNLRAAEELTLCQRPRISEKTWLKIEALESLTLCHKCLCVHEWRRLVARALKKRNMKCGSRDGKTRQRHDKTSDVCEWDEIRDLKSACSEPLLRRSTPGSSPLPNHARLLHDPNQTVCQMI